VKLLHLNCIVDNGAFATHNEATLVASDRDDADVKIRRQPAIQTQLFRAELTASLQSRSVDEIELDRLLDLVGVRSRQDHPGNVRLAPLQACHGMRKNPCVPPIL